MRWRRNKRRTIFEVVNDYRIHLYLGIWRRYVEPTAAYPTLENCIFTGNTGGSVGRRYVEQQQQPHAGLNPGDIH